MTRLPGASTFRRTPVILMHSTTERLTGTLEVALREGLTTVKQVLMREEDALRTAYIGEIPINTSPDAQPPISLDRFQPRTWEAEGRCVLAPALNALAEVLMWDVMWAEPDSPGDHKPLIFITLLDQPSDDWEAAASRLQPALQCTNPLLVALTASAETSRVFKALTPHALALTSEDASVLSDYYGWVASAIGLICTANRHGRSVTLPSLPQQIVSVQ